MQEEWKDIVIVQGNKKIDFTGKFQVSNLGRVRNIQTFHVRKLQKHKSGYWYITLKYDKKPYTFKVHRLVATAFIPNPNNLPMVNHKDENKLNNRVDNLEWCDAKYNSNYGTGHQRQTESIRKSVKRGKESPCYGIKRSEETRKKISDNHADMSGDKNPAARAVICLNTKQVFTTGKEACEWCGLKNSASISFACNGKKETAGKHPITREKLKWMYYEDYLKLNS